LAEPGDLLLIVLGTIIATVIGYRTVQTTSIRDGGGGGGGLRGLRRAQDSKEYGVIIIAITTTFPLSISLSLYW